MLTWSHLKLQRKNKLTELVIPYKEEIDCAEITIYNA